MSTRPHRFGPDDLCERCRVGFWQFTNLVDNPCVEDRLKSCCGAKGFDRWNFGTNQWECSECGGATSNDPNYNNKYSSVPSKTNTLGGCNHVWKQYVGLRETYEFCEKCNLKR